MNRPNRQLVTATVLCIGAALFAPAVVRAQANAQPAPAAVTEPAVVAPITPTAPANTAGAAEIRRPIVGPNGSTSSAGNAVYEVVRVVGALAVVIAVIVGLKVAAAKVLGIRSAGPNANKGVRVLSRTMMGPKQQLLLLQVGRKLVLVGDSAGRLTPVTEITDPDEVAELAAQALGTDKSSARGGGQGSFGNLFQRDRERFTSDDDTDADLEASLYGRRQDLGLDDEQRSSLASNLASDLAAESANRDGDRGDRGDPGGPALNTLADRVRKLGRQFSNPS